LWTPIALTIFVSVALDSFLRPRCRTERPEEDRKRHGFDPQRDPKKRAILNASAEDDFGTILV